VRAVSPERQVLDRILKLGVGQPSTLATFSQTISKRFLDKNGSLNGRAQQALSHARKIMPELFEVSRIIEMEKCFADGSLPSSERVRAALGRINIRPETSEQSSSPAIKI